MAKKKSENTYKNRHIDRSKDQPVSEYSFPNSNKNTKKFCTIDDILNEFVPNKHVKRH